MDRLQKTVLSSLFFLLACAISVGAQSDSSVVAGDSSSVSTAPQGSDPVDSAYTLKKGDNELGFWGGGSFAATTVFGGLTDAEASDRKFFIAAFRYGRTLARNHCGRHFPLISDRRFRHLDWR